MKVSVIIPVYNTEKYLKKCIESVMNQTLTDIEILVVNDGSKDSSEKIINKLLKVDKRIRYYSQENKGVSAARNVGLQHAKGEFILFVDSDDTILPETLDELYNYAIRKRVEIVRFGIDISNKKNIVNKCEFKEYVYKDIIENYNYASVCYELISNKLIINNNIKFDESIKYGEDLLFNMLIYLKANKIYLTDKIYYRYTYNENSAIRKASIDSILKKVNDTIYVYSIMYKYNKLYGINYSIDKISIRILMQLNYVMKEFFQKKLDISYNTKKKYIKEIMYSQGVDSIINKCKIRVKNKSINDILINCIIKKKYNLYCFISFLGYKLKGGMLF